MHTLAWWPTVLAVFVATVSDLKSRRIPNWLVVPLLVGGLLASTVTGGWHGLASSVEGISLAAVALGLFYWLGGMGMGDVKLCAAIGAWIGPQQLLLALVLMGLAGGVMAFAWALYGGFLKEALSGTSDLIFGLGKRRFGAHERLTLANPAAHKMPYAPAIAIGTVLSFFAAP